VGVSVWEIWCPLILIWLFLNHHLPRPPVALETTALYHHQISQPPKFKRSVAHAHAHAHAHTRTRTRTHTHTHPITDVCSVPRCVPVCVCVCVASCMQRGCLTPSVPKLDCKFGINRIKFTGVMTEIVRKKVIWGGTIFFLPILS